ncbi:MAG: hypothetical protein QM831_44920 [Kofleriaceae bacterium]
MIVVLTGASGAGKTAIALAMESRVRTFRFDTIGVPSPDVMASYGSDHQPGGAWQRAMTLEWFARIAPLSEDVLFEGQMRLAFIVEAAAHVGVVARIVLVDCADDVRAARLSARGQPELATTDMMRWAAYLRDEARTLEAVILDTTSMSIDQTVASVEQLFRARSNRS